MERSTIQRLLLPEAFPHPVGDIQLIETHISWVILSGRFAYKIKKPVDLGFLNFSELSMREHYCHEELRLNRRYSPELYLDVVPITGTEQTPAISGSGPVLDYAVKMQQFETAKLLESLSETQGLDNHLLRAVAAELAKSHREFPVAHSAGDNPAAMRDAMFQNFDQIREYALDPIVTAQLETLEEWTRVHLAQLLPFMAQRAQQGQIKDLHGDLHLNNMVLLDGAVRFFDCIEFNEDFRVMDTIAEIAFLAMDVAYKGEPAQRVLNDYLEYTGDYCGLPLLNLYRVYFAMVRAKVNLLREPVASVEIQQTPAYQAFSRYVALALKYTAKNPPFMALMHGIAGSGKSTIAAHAAEQFGAIRLRSDVERKRLFGLQPDDSSDAIQANIYSMAASENTFDQLTRLSREVIQSGLPCIVDATFLHRKVRKKFIALAEALGIPVLIMDCIASQSCIDERLRQRTRKKNDASEADIDIMRQQLADAQAFDSSEQPYVVSIDSEKPFNGEPITQYLQEKRG